MDPNAPTSSSGISGVQALNWARVLLFVKQHGVAGAALIAALWAVGFFSKAQSYGCGI